MYVRRTSMNTVLGVQVKNVKTVKDCKNEDVNSLMVESRLNIFHSKFNWRIFCNTDSWISCLKISTDFTFTNNNNYYEP